MDIILYEYGKIFSKKQKELISAQEHHNNTNLDNYLKSMNRSVHHLIQEWYERPMNGDDSDYNYKFIIKSIYSTDEAIGLFEYAAMYCKVITKRYHNKTRYIWVLNN